MIFLFFFARSYHSKNQANKMIKEDQDESTKRTIDRLVANPTVKELILFNTDGLILQTNLDSTRAQNYKTIFRLFSYEAQKVIKNLDPTDELTFIRMRTKDVEIILAPEENGILGLVQGVLPYDPPYRPPKKEKNVTSTGGNSSDVNKLHQHQQQEDEETKHEVQNEEENVSEKQTEDGIKHQ